MLTLQDYLKKPEHTLSPDIYDLDTGAAEAAFTEVYGEKYNVANRDQITPLMESLWNILKPTSLPEVIIPESIESKALIVRVYLQEAIEAYLNVKVDFTDDKSEGVKLYKDYLYITNQGLLNAHIGDSSIYLSGPNAYSNLMIAYDWLHENKALIENNINMISYTCQSTKCLIGWIAEIPEFAHLLPMHIADGNTKVSVDYHMLSIAVFGMSTVSLTWEYLFGVMNGNDFDHFMRRFESVINDCNNIQARVTNYTLKVKIKDKI